MLVPQEDLEVIFDGDVVVIGGGAAGIAAAVSAARNGAKTLLVEQRGFAGGTGAFMPIPAFAPYTDGIHVVSKGIAFEILEKTLKESNKDLQQMNGDNLDWVTIDTEAYKRVCDELIQSNNVEVLFHTSCIRTLCEDGVINAIVIANKNGRSIVKGKVYIDATGDADLVYMAGSPVTYGEGDSTVQPGTMCFVVSGIDKEKTMEYINTYDDPQFSRLVIEAQEKGDIPKGRKRVSSFSWVTNTTASFNFGHVYGVDGTDAKSLTAGDIEGRQLAKIYTQFLKKYVPGFENANLIHTGDQVGIRESRKIVADYNMRVDDFKNKTDFEDEIARNCYFIDVHLPNQDSKMVMEYLPEGESHGIPYRCMIPINLKNLLVAGRTVGSDRLINSALRVMPNCFTIGQAAGVAAYLSAKDNKYCREIDVKKMQSLLVEQGAWIKEK